MTVPAGYSTDFEESATAETPTGRGISHAAVLRTKVEAAHELVDAMIEKATIGSITGLPETYKSWLGQALSLRISNGGTFLGRKVVETGAVGYWWQDDSREDEIRRIQAYSNRHGFTDSVQPTWYLNEGLKLPEDIAVLRAEIKRKQQLIVFFDSLYNFIGSGVKLKDEDVGEIFAQLKREICDQTGCTICVIDHSPWPTDTNQNVRRAYGSVFKAAAIRWGIYIERKNDTLFIEARGNNLAGLSRTPAIWNADELELRLVEPPTQTDDLADRIDDFLRENVGATTRLVLAGLVGNEKHIKDRLNGDGRFTRVPAILFGKPSNAICWARRDDVPDLLNSTSAENVADVELTLTRVTDDTSADDGPTYVVGGSQADVGRQPHPDGRPTSNDDDLHAAPGGDNDRLTDDEISRIGRAPYAELQERPGRSGESQPT